MRSACTLIGLFILLAGVVYSQEVREDTAGTSSTATSDASKTDATIEPEEVKVEVTVTRTEMDDFTSSADVTIWIHSTVPINLQSISLRLPAAYVYDDRSSNVAVELNNLYDVDPGRRREYHTTIEAVHWYYGLVPISFRKKLEAKVIATYQFPGEPGEQTSTGSVDLPVAGPFSGVFVGAIIGVTVIYLILLARGKIRWIDYLIGLAGTLIVIILARFTTTDVVALPVAIELRDSAAGFLIGLLCQAIEEPVAKRFFPKLRS